MLMHKVLSSLLVVVLGLGTMPCACAAMANVDVTAASHAHHQQDTQHSSEDSNCSCAACIANCGDLSAVVAELDAILPAAGINQLDDFDAVEIKSISYPQSSRSIALHDPPFLHRWPPPETPVLRYDRLLD